ncbi:hypothetical protein SAMN02745163_00305 [Clostridium cavendishii DSM 21758]|uniref:Copper resistance protein NlpE n=1 Tax=Clostridium cavendishii DSM 21758 TaxID=1121302 RepID=A0A1M6BBD8_9CLOT|nr:hypothetical protein [Clostridium cavendishii]SHI46006.1 hypothetical protein SAMN02745163_00305 [Clostridium cavendishii DSM 21758]
MKKILLFSALFLAVILIGKSDYNTYTGTYCCEGSTNISIKLKSDDSFELVRQSNRSSEVINGKYSIYDNNFELEFNDKDNEELFKDLSKGKVYGSTLIIENKHKTFSFKKL